MNISDVAKKTGLTSKAIRFYEEKGLVTPPLRSENGYRSYPDDAVLALRIIATGQKAGFSLDELRALLPSDLASWEHGTLLDTLRRKVQDIEALQAQLAQSKAHLVELMAQIEAKPQDMDCATNARRMLSEMQLAEADIAPTTKKARRRH